MDGVKELRELYKEGINIYSYLKKKGYRDLEAIRLSYDVQSGDDIKKFKENTSLFNENIREILKVFDVLDTKNKTILEAGIGEGTTLVNIYKYIKKKPKKMFGFDISKERIKHCEKFLKENDVFDCKLFIGNLYDIPLKDASIDIVYSSHSIEPNRGKEREILKELIRITRDYLIIIEPIYEFCNKEVRERMDKHNYIDKLYTTIKKMNLNIINIVNLKVSLNEMNPTTIIVIKKERKC